MGNNFLKVLNENFGKVLGGFLGLLVALIIVAFGFWKGIFVIVCILAGIFIGAKAEKHEGVRNLLDRIWFFGERF